MDPLGGNMVPLKDFLDNMRGKSDEASQVVAPSPEQESLMRLVGKIDQVPGLAALPDDYQLVYKEIDELMLLLDLLKMDATVRVLGEDTFPGTIIGHLQAAILDTGASSKDKMSTVVRKVISFEEQRPGNRRALAEGILTVLEAIQAEGEVEDTYGNLDPEVMRGLAAGAFMGLLPGQCYGEDIFLQFNVQAVYEALENPGPVSCMMAVGAVGAVRTAQNDSNGKMTQACAKFGNAMKGLECDAAMKARVAMCIVCAFGGGAPGINR